MKQLKIGPYKTTGTEGGEIEALVGAGVMEE